MASIHAIAPQTFLNLPNPKPRKPISLLTKPTSSNLFSTRKPTRLIASVVSDQHDVMPMQTVDCVDHQESVVESVELASHQLSFEGAASGGFGVGEERGNDDEEFYRLVDRSINATIVLAAGTFGLTKLLTIDQDYWHGWTVYEIVRYAPQHNWTAYEEALKANPVLAKMVISGVVYSIGDWIAQCFEGKPLFEFDRARMFRSGLVGFTLHGSLSHYYYQICEELFPFQGWWVVPLKVAFDQTIWAAIWNSIYFTVLGFLRLESPINIYSELKATFWPMLTAGWKLWPFAHLVTYGLIPVEQRLLWVDCVELIWVTILSTLSNEKSETRILDAPAEASSSSPSISPLEE